MKVRSSVSSQPILKGLSRNFVTIIILSFGNNPENLTCNAILRINQKGSKWVYTCYQWL